MPNRDDFDKGDGGRNPGPQLTPPTKRASIIYTLLFAALVGYLVYSFGGSWFSQNPTDTLATSEFVTAVKDERVTEVTYHTSDGSVEGKYYADGSNAVTAFKSAYVGADSLDELMEEHSNVRFTVDTSSNDLWETVLVSFVPTLLMIAILVYFMNQMQGQNGRAMSFGKTKAQTTPETRPRSSSPTWRA